MKIGIDARMCEDGGSYGLYVWELIQEFCNMYPEHEVVIYKNNFSSDDVFPENTALTVLKQNRLKYFDQRKTRKIMESENFGMMFFFDHHIPIGYKKNYLIFIEHLKEVFFPKGHFFKKHSFQHQLQKSIKHAEKVVVMDGGSALELNEKLDIPEYKIEKIQGFFPQVVMSGIPEVKIDVKAKHNIRGDYLIYDSGNEMHNNFERILKTLRKLKEKEITLSLIILCEETNKDLDIRSLSLDLEISDQIYFLGPVEAGLEYSYYTQSSGVVFTSIYESFPFHFSKALNYNVPIFANDIPANRQVMGENVSYLDPLSIHNITDTLADRITFSKDPDYTQVYKKYSPKKSAKQLQDLLEY